MSFEIFVGFDARECAAYEVCVKSMRNHCAALPNVTPLVEAHLLWLELYERRHERR